MNGHWKDRAPSPLLSDTGPRGEPMSTSLDRRWLWRLEGQLAVLATTDYLRDLRRDLAQYLHETCSHHWLPYSGDADIPAHRQCLWCNEVSWSGGDS